MAHFARGHLPGSSGYIQTANNTKANGHDTEDLQHGACESQSEGQTTGDRPIADTLRRQSKRKQETMDLTVTPFSKDPQQNNCDCIHHQKMPKVIQPRHNVSVPSEDLEEGGDSRCKTKVFCDGQTDDVSTDTPENCNPRAESVYDDVNTDNPDNAQPRAESEKSVQLSGSVSTWDGRIDNETQLPGDQGTVPSMWFKETIQEKHQKRLETLQEDCGDCKDGFHPTIRHDWISHKAKEKVVLRQCRQRVGLIHCQKCGYGTCFRAGEFNIVTCHHVTRRCKDHRIKAVFHCQGRDQRATWVYEVKEEKADSELDYVIYKLLDNGKGFPPAFTKFRDSTPNNGRSEDLTYIVCFQKDSTGGSRLEVHSDTVRMNSNTFDERCYDMNLAVMEKYPNNTQKDVPYGHADLHRQSGHIPLLCKVIHGGSGGVGVYLDENGNTVVDFMYRRGYPGFFYETVADTVLTTEQKIRFPGCLRVEVGLDIQTLIQKSGQELWMYEE